MDAKKLYTLLAVPTCADECLLSELKALVARYPWFSLAYQLLMETTYRIDSEEPNEYAAEAAVYSVNRAHFYWRLQQPTIVYHAEEDGASRENQEETKEPVKNAPKPFIVIGGEYFSSSDLGDVAIGEDPLSRFIVEQPKINPNTSPLNNIDFQDTDEMRENPMDYVTETLAQIYVSQQLYDLAIDTYNKLILQIPEKSTYFVAQIKEIKKRK